MTVQRRVAKLHLTIINNIVYRCVFVEHDLWTYEDPYGEDAHRTITMLKLLYANSSQIEENKLLWL